MSLNRVNKAHGALAVDKAHRLHSAVDFAQLDASGFEANEIEACVVDDDVEALEEVERQPARLKKVDDRDPFPPAYNCARRMRERCGSSPADVAYLICVALSLASAFSASIACDGAFAFLAVLIASMRAMRSAISVLSRSASASLSAVSKSSAR
jgi:hypothetical protein